MTNTYRELPSELSNVNHDRPNSSKHLHTANSLSGQSAGWFEFVTYEGSHPSKRYDIRHKPSSDSQDIGTGNAFALCGSSRTGGFHVPPYPTSLYARTRQKKIVSSSYRARLLLSPHFAWKLLLLVRHSSFAVFQPLPCAVPLLLLLLSVAVLLPPSFAAPLQLA
jgi:hypothetical protein